MNTMIVRYYSSKDMDYARQQQLNSKHTDIAYVIAEMEVNNYLSKSGIRINSTPDVTLIDLSNVVYLNKLKTLSVYDANLHKKYNATHLFLCIFDSI